MIYLYIKIFSKDLCMFLAISEHQTLEIPGLRGKREQVKGKMTSLRSFRMLEAAQGATPGEGFLWPSRLQTSAKTPS